MQAQEPTAEVTIGTVVSSRRWSDTHFEVYGRKNAPRFYTDVEQRQEIFVKDTQGRESRWYVSPDKVGFREGSNIAIVTGQESSEHPNLIHYVSNLDSGEEYSDPTPVSDGASFFNGWGLGVIIAVVLFAIIAAMAPIGAKNAAKGQGYSIASFQPTAEDIKACPFGKSLYQNFNKPGNDLMGCPRGAEYHYVKRVCECATSAQDFVKRMQVKAEKQQKIRTEKEAAGNTAMGAIIAVVVGLVVGYLRSRSINSKLQEKAQALREKYAQVLVQEAAKYGVNLEVVDLQNLILRRR